MNPTKVEAEIGGIDRAKWVILPIKDCAALPQAFAVLQRGWVKVRSRRTQTGYRRDYKAKSQRYLLRAFFDDNQCLIDYVNFATLTNPLAQFRGWSRWSLNGRAS